MIDYENSPFHRFFGWKLLALIAVLFAYTFWYTGPGFYGELTRLADYANLQAKPFYTGAEAVSTLQELNNDGRKLKFITLIFDIPYMILNALVFEALIAFGLRHIKPKSVKWNLLFALPIIFLFADLFEDSFIALTMVTDSLALGTLAGLFTALKFFSFIAASLTGLILSLIGLVFWLKNRKAG